MTSSPAPSPASRPTSRPASPPASAGPVVTVGDYTLLSKLGEGGMGIVHLARRPGGERVALKVLRPHIVGDDEARARLAREVTSLSRIRSRWVAEILDADPWAPIPYVATRYVPGLSLHDHVVEEGPITGPDLLWFARCLAEGVASVHACGVLHRDVKPSNVLLEGRTPILIDFGLARVADDPKLTHTGWLLGTPGYLAPEILYGDDATTASDVHSWASTVAYAAMGRPPFGRGPSMAIMDRVRRGEHDLSDAPPAVRALLAEALDPEPRRRPGLAQVLARLQGLTDPACQAGLAAPGWPGGADGGGSDLTEPIALLDPLWLPPGLDGTAPPIAPASPTRVLTTLEPPAHWGDGSDEPYPWAAPVHLDPAPARRVGPAERLRRALLLVLLAGLAGIATAAAPWPTLAVVVTLAWLLRSGSLAASAAGDRRRVRGRRWYDPVLVLLRAPWDLVRSIPVTVLLVLWSAGLAAAAALLCYAAASQAVTLGAVGAAFAGAVWTGPGGSRVRSPLHRALRPLARPWRVWLTVLVALALLALVGAWLVVDRGTSWVPADAQPFAGWRGWLW